MLFTFGFLEAVVVGGGLSLIIDSIIRYHDTTSAKTRHDKALERLNTTTSNVVNDHCRRKKMPTLLSLPDELLLQILSHNVPPALRSRTDFLQHIRHNAASKRLLRLTRDAFFHSFTHTFSITCLYSPSPRFAHTQVHVDGVLTAKTSFVRQVRRVDLRLYVYYRESVETAVGEVRGVLGRYGRLRWLRVGISTGSWEVAEEIRGRVEGAIGEEGKKRGIERKVEVFVEVELMGHVVEGK